ncbi:M48 metallopeptidase family protein [Quatrionicoccus australiensis]|uniref:M48 metallopeptidase family protein n=1 Tax=Quatrionicoccus australiensis TaxID=138118 RepID=UPI001CFC0D40|nr:YgjP-like metallopeptidase domain-containing protein [Quatrionicoccus australiensis]MCB4361425.1 M48 family metallopeptidase [Quatrionicoccus australiensis]
MTANKSPTPYLAGYPADLVAQVQALIEGDQLAGILLKKYPQPHAVRTDRALYDYVLDLKNTYLRNAGQISKVAFDSKLHVIRNALGTHTSIARVQGSKLKAKREIHVSTLFREVPEDFLRMIVVHELAHTKERAHDKAFYQLCRHMAPDYFQLEFDLRTYLCHLDAGGRALWPATPDSLVADA